VDYSLFPHVCSNYHQCRKGELELHPVQLRIVPLNQFCAVLHCGIFSFAHDWNQTKEMGMAGIDLYCVSLCIFVSKISDRSLAGISIDEGNKCKVNREGSKGDADN